MMTMSPAKRRALTSAHNARRGGPPVPAAAWRRQRTAILRWLSRHHDPGRISVPALARLMRVPPSTLKGWLYLSPRRPSQRHATALNRAMERIRRRAS